MSVLLRQLMWTAVAIVVLTLLQFVGNWAEFFTTLAVRAGIFIILAVSLNIVNGMTGQFSIGHAGFMAVGAYIAAKFTLVTMEARISGIPEIASDQILFVVALLLGGVFAAICGLLVGLPSLRLKGDYLAIVTLGFGEIIRVVFQNTEYFGRALGLSGIPSRTSLFMIYGWALITIIAAKRIAQSSHGRSLAAIREDEVAAEAMGVNTTAYKVRAFVVSAFFAGVAGGLFSHVYTINPGRFTFVESMEIVVMVTLGGLGSTTGAVVAAVFLSLLPEGLRSLFGHFLGGEMASKADQVRMPIYGILLVLLMLFRPQGLFGTREIWDRKPQPQKRPEGTLQGGTA